MRLLSPTSSWPCNSIARISSTSSSPCVLKWSRGTAEVTRPVDESCSGTLICVHFGGCCDARGDPGRRSIHEITQVFDLDLIRRVEPFSGSIGLPEGSENVFAHTMEVEVVAVLAFEGALAAGRVGLMAAVVAPTLPSVPALVDEVTAARARLGVRM